MASFQINTSPLGNRNNVETTATHLLPYEPVAKKIISNKQRSSEISDTSKVEVSSFGTKTGIGKKVVHLQYHKPPEYANLSKDQNEELREWRLKNPDNKGRKKGRDNKRQNRKIP